MPKTNDYLLKTHTSPTPVANPLFSVDHGGNAFGPSLRTGD